MMLRRENGEINSHLRVSAFKKAEESKERMMVRRERENGEISQD